MRFVADGPSVPDDLLVARDLGDVIFFCGAGVSQANAHLPNFEKLGRDVIRLLGAAQNSPARQLLEKAIEMGQMAGVGGLLATDRVFGLLEREFEVNDVREAVAEAIRPPEGYALDAHRILLNLATSRTGVTRLVTTNFDLLFEECEPALESWGPPRLPDPRSDREFRGITHLHGRVDKHYRRPQDDEFVVSSADFGRAYLSEGWATRFIQSLLARFQIVFVGYTADDPPVQYLLEALNLRAGSRNRLFAFQSGESTEAAALWEHRGVQAIPFDSSNGFAPLWDTLAAWAHRARDVDGWYTDLLSSAKAGPSVIDAHVRGQIAHVVSTREGAHRIATAQMPIDASWLLAFDPQLRYGHPGPLKPDDDASGILDPFEALGFDFDAPPEPTQPDDKLNQRKIPDGAWDPFAPTRLDYEESSEASTNTLRGTAATVAAPLSPRLASLGIWIHRVAHQPVALWWAAHQSGLHPDIRRSIESRMRHEPQQFPESVRRGWRLLFSAWSDMRANPDMLRYDILDRSVKEGWSTSLVREIAGMYRPQLKIEQVFGIDHPLTWSDAGVPEAVVSIDIEYPHPHEGLHIPDEYVGYAVSQFRANLELAVSLEREVIGDERLYFETTRAPDNGPALPDNSYGLTGPVLMVQNLMARWLRLDPTAARDEVRRWPVSDEHIFARLRIWAAGHELIPADEAARMLLSFSERVFWGSLHERDLLYALRDRWAELPSELKTAIEARLLTGAFPWSNDVRGGAERAIADDRLSRLHWLSSHGVQFTFDLAAEMAALRAAAPGWTERAGDEVAKSRAPVVYSIETDNAAEPLLETPIPEILAKAREAGRLDFFDRVQREPFRGLSEHRPVRALGALTHVGRKGEAPRTAWSTFLSADMRQKDNARMISVIVGRLVRLPMDQFQKIAYPVSEWMEAIAARLYGDTSQAFEPLWSQMMQALATGDPGRRPRLGNGWADIALNAPVGRLVNLLMKDPAKDGLGLGAQFPAHWTSKLQQLLSLPGNLRSQALVMIGLQSAWLYAIDPVWTARELLPAADDQGDDGDAFWDGVFWAARPSRLLYPRLKAGLAARSRQPRWQRQHGNVLAGLLLSGWLGERENTQSARHASDVELREILIHTGDELRGQFIWHLEQLLTADDGKWRDRVIPFLADVWPKQRALRTPANSARLADLALASGDLMPGVVDLILPRLVPVRGLNLRMILKDGDDHPAVHHPRATLDLLWGVLAEDPRQWPYKIEEVLNRLTEAPETAGDPRLSELRRRRER